MLTSDTDKRIPKAAQEYEIAARNHGPYSQRFIFFVSSEGAQ